MKYVSDLVYRWENPEKGHDKVGKIGAIFDELSWFKFIQSLFVKWTPWNGQMLHYTEDDF